MRVKLNTAGPQAIADMRKSSDKGLMLQVITGGGVNVFFATDENDLRQLDQAGNCKAGFTLNQAATPAPFVIYKFMDRLYAFPSGACEIEVIQFNAEDTSSWLSTLASLFGRFLEYLQQG